MVLVVIVVSRSTLILADLLVLAITWKATFKTSRENVRALGQRMSLSAILFRDGEFMAIALFVNLSIPSVTCEWPAGVIYVVYAELCVCC